MCEAVPFCSFQSIPGWGAEKKAFFLYEAVCRPVVGILRKKKQGCLYHHSRQSNKQRR